MAACPDLQNEQGGISGMDRYLYHIYNYVQKGVWVTIQLIDLSHQNKGLRIF